MTKLAPSICALLAAAAVSGAALAQAPAPAAPAGPPAPTVGPGVSNDEVRAPRPPRARGIPAALAVEAAAAANAACAAQNLKTTTLVADSAGVPIVVLSNDGAAAITQRIAMGKALATLKYKDTSAAIATRAAAEPALAAELAADPRILASRPGSLPIMAGADLVGAIAVSGAPSGATDAVCATAGLDKIRDRVK
jgi:uncharacterized protein GlcG (DUF336 family)